MASPNQPTVIILESAPTHANTTDGEGIHPPQLPKDQKSHANTTDSEGIRQLPEDQKIFQAKKFNVKIFVVLVKLLLFVSVLTCLVFNKLTLIKIIADLHLLSDFSKNGSQSANQYLAQSKDSTLKQTANLYWILFFIVLVPNIITWIRCIFSGVMKNSTHRPWPTCLTTLVGLFIYCMHAVYFVFKPLAFTEAITETFLVFFIFITLPPEVSVVLMCGVYSTQSLIEHYCEVNKNKRNMKICQSVISPLGVLCQFAGLVAVIGFLIMASTVEAGQNQIFGFVLAVPCLLLLSFVWSRKIQKLTYTAYTVVPSQSQHEASPFSLLCSFVKSIQNPTSTGSVRWRASKIILQLCC